MANFSENADKIRESILSDGMASMKSRIRDVKIVQEDCGPTHKKPAKKKYTQEETADRMVGIYKENIKLPTHPPNDPKKEQVKADTHGIRANIRALSNSLANIRNGGYAGPTTEFTPSANGDVNPGRRCGYNALVVAGTEMTLEEYEEHVNNLFEKKRGLWDNIHDKRKRGESPAKPGDKDYPKTLNVEEKSEKDPCWDGYKRKPGTKKFDKGSCVKEEEQIDEVTYPSDFVKGSGVAKKKYGRPVQHDQPVRGMTSPVRKTIDETSVIDELKNQLMELTDIGWQSIDKVMRSIAKEHDITPKELHKEFKYEEGMIPDEWIKENRIKEDCGYIPLDEVVNLNKTGNIYDVTLMWRAHTRRLKFFWPSVKVPTNSDMQDQVDKFYPGGKLIAFYPSSAPGDNQINTIVVVPALSDSYNYWEEGDWEFMSEEASRVYDYICTEEGEPLGPVNVNEDNQFEVLVADHDTGEERLVCFTEDMSGMSQKSGDKRSTESGAGMTAQGVKKYNARTGGNLKTAVTTPPSKLKPGSKAAGRRKSFCARSRGWDGERGKAARKRWNC